MEISVQASQQLVQALQSQSPNLTALKPGDTISAKVVGHTSTGNTLLALAGKQVPVALATPPSLGTVLNLQVQSTLNGLTLTLLSQIPPQATSTTGNAATTIPTTAQPTTSPTSGQTPAVQNSISAQGIQFAATSAPVASSATSAPLVTQAANAALFSGLTAGDHPVAQVVGATSSGQTVLSIAGRQFPVSLPASLPASPPVGSAIVLQVQTGAQGLQLSIVAPPASSGAPAAATVTNNAVSTTATPVQTGATTAPTAPAPPATATAPTTPPPIAAVVPTWAPLLSKTAIKALGNQNSVVALVAAVLRLGTRTADLPQSAQNAIADLKARTLNLSDQPLSAQALKTAIARSGTFMESTLGSQASATSLPQSANGAPPTQTPSLQGDLKAILLLLKGALSKLPGDSTLDPQSGRPPHPPERGVAPRAGRLESIADPQQPLDAHTGKSLLAKTESALSRLHLLQLASMPDADAIPFTAKAEWQVELPFTVGQHAGTLNLQITRDEQQPEQEDAERGWHMRFALNPGKMGEVGAEIGFLGGNTNVVLWAERPETVEAIRLALPELSDDLSAQGLTVGAIRVRRPSPAPPPPHGTGHYVDVGT